MNKKETDSMNKKESFATFDLSALNPGVEIDFPGGGKIWLRNVNPEKFREFEKATGKTIAKIIKGKRHEWRKSNDAALNDLCYEYMIVKWEGFKGPDKKELTCDKKTKLALMNKAPNFLTWVSARLEELELAEEEHEEELGKNLLTSQGG